jgi:hypothetical protein
MSILCHVHKRGGKKLFLLGIHFCLLFVVTLLCVTELLPVPDAWMDHNQTWHSGSEWSGDGLHRVWFPYFQTYNLY